LLLLIKRDELPVEDADELLGGMITTVSFTCSP
jgi:hypothetical protein